MGLFGPKERCSICGSPASGLVKVKLSDGVLCADCHGKCSPLCTSLSSKRPADILRHLDVRSSAAAEYAAFKPTDKAGSMIFADRHTQRWCAPILYSKKVAPDLFDFSEVVDYELVEDGSSVTKGGIGSAVVGGALFGGVGAIVGGNAGKKQKDIVSKLSVRISLSNEFISQLEIPLITQDAKRGGMLYRSALESARNCISLLDIITHDAQPSAALVSPSASVADELLKFKQLLDVGAITEDEYNAKKKQLLGL